MILLYHKIHPEAKTQFWVTPDAFYVQMADLRSKKVVYLDDYNPLDPRHAVITFDGVYENVWKYAVPILEHFDYPFELFIIGERIGGGNEFDVVEPPARFADEEILARMVKAGGRLQWHTWSHRKLLGPQPQETYDRELTVPVELRELSPQGFQWFAYPHGRHDEGLRKEVEHHFSGALAVDGGSSNDRYDLDRMTVLDKTRLSSSTVSVIIPCYNYGHLVAEAIESVLCQTYPPEEILFIDDASVDRSVEVARRYEPMIRVEVNPKNLGVVANFRKAVDLTKGDYICFLGADNRFRSDYLEKTKAVLDANPDVGVAYTHFMLFDKRAAVMAARMDAKPHPTVPDIFLKEFHAVPVRDIREENFIHGSSMYRRAAYDQAGGYSQDNLPEDHSLFVRMLEKGWKAKLVDAYLLEYRQHSKDQINLLKGLEVENAYLRAQTQSLADQIADREQQVQALREQVAEREQQVQALREQVAEREQQVQALTAQLGEREEQVQALAVQVAQRNEQARALTEQVAQRDEQMQALTAQLNEITLSRAWRTALLLRRIRVLLIPPGSRRARLLKRPLSILLSPFGFRDYPMMARDLALIRASELFDEAWYLAHNSDVTQAEMDPASHYLLFGAFEGRDPGPNFASRWYLETYPDVRAADTNPLVHYLKFGREENRLIEPEEISKPQMEKVEVLLTSRGTGSPQIDLLARARGFVLTATTMIKLENLKRALRNSRRFGFSYTVARAKEELGQLRDAPQQNDAGSRRHARTQPKRVNVINAELSRLLIASGVLNKCWYGGSEVSVNFLHSARDFSPNLSETATEQLSLAYIEDTQRIHSEFGSDVGGAPLPELVSIYPLRDIEDFVDSIEPADTITHSSDHPSFSIVTSYYQHREYFESCVTSVRELIDASDNWDVEWIVVCDDPHIGIEDFKSLIPKGIRREVTIIHDGKNEGIARRLNQAIDLCSNDWVLFLDSDDLIHRRAIQTLSSYIRRFPQARYISSCMVDIDEEGKTLRYRKREARPAKLISEGMIAGHLMAVRRDVFSEHGPLEEGAEGCQDYELALRLLFKEPILLIPDYLYLYRWHNQTQSVKAKKRQRLTATSIRHSYVEEFVEKRSGKVITSESSRFPEIFENLDISNRDSRLISGVAETQNGAAIIRTQGNRPHLLPEAVRSVVTQNVPFDIFVAVHGDSSAVQNVRDQLSSLMDTESITILGASDTSKERGYPFNIVIDSIYAGKDRLDFICFVDDDDILYPNFGWEMTRALAATSADVVYGASNRRFLWDEPEAGYRPLPPACLLAENFIPTNSFCVRNSKLKSSNLRFNEDLTYLEDWHFLISMLNAGFKFASLENTLIEFRITGDGNIPVKQNPDLWRKNTDEVRVLIENTCRKLGRYRLYSLLLGFDSADYRGNLTSSQFRLLTRTKGIIDRICPVEIAGV